jgi:hypothetical protein
VTTLTTSTSILPAGEPTEGRAWVARLHLLLAAQSLLLVLASVNRLWDATDVHVLPHDALRLVDLLNLLVFPFASVLVFHLLLEHVLPGTAERTRLRLRLGFVAAVYLFAASYGMHEAADYLNARFCDGGETAGSLCQIVEYHDDELSHLLFFAGFAGIDMVLLLAQAAAPGRDPLERRDLALIGANAALVAAATVANLGFEEIGYDLVVVAAVAALATWLWRRCGARPLIVYFGSAYVVGLALTVVAQAV